MCAAPDAQLLRSGLKNKTETPTMYLPHLTTLQREPQPMQIILRENCLTVLGKRVGYHRDETTSVAGTHVHRLISNPSCIAVASGRLLV